MSRSTNFKMQKSDSFLLGLISSIKKVYYIEYEVMQLINKQCHQIGENNFCKMLNISRKHLNYISFSYYRLLRKICDWAKMFK